MVPIVILFSVHHEHAIFIVLVRTSFGIKIFAGSSGFCETSTLGFTFLLCYLNVIFERSSLVVEFFHFVGNDCWNRRLQFKYKCQDLILQQKSINKSVRYFIYPGAKLNLVLRDNCFKSFKRIALFRTAVVVVYVE